MSKVLIVQMKTNATRLLERLEIPFELREYTVDEDDLSAIKVAREVGLPADQVFKTLVAKSDGGDVVFAVVPGDRELDLKALARLSGKRRMELAPISLLRQLTGYIRGGVTALAAKRDYPVVLDSSAGLHPVISISAGVRGAQVLLRPQDYIRATAARVGPISRPAAAD